MNPSKPRPWDFWSEESSLTGLLIFTLAYLFVICALGDFNLGAIAGRLLFSFILVTGVMTTFRKRWLSSLVIVMALAGLILGWLEYLHQAWSLTILNTALGLVILGLFLAVLIVQVFQKGKVTGHRIRGAIVVYLLIGGMWSFFYFIVNMALPHAFHWPEGFAADNWEAVQQMLTYFSFITLTTTGYGDVTPAIPLTRTLAMFEALTGQLYLVITLARLVSLAIVPPGLSKASKEPPRSEKAG